jgi:hypothetical protein
MHEDIVDMLLRNVTDIYDLNWKSLSNEVHVHTFISNERTWNNLA